MSEGHILLSFPQNVIGSYCFFSDYEFTYNTNNLWNVVKLKCIASLNYRIKKNCWMQDVCFYLSSIFFAAISLRVSSFYAHKKNYWSISGGRCQPVFLPERERGTEAAPVQRPQESIQFQPVRSPLWETLHLQKSR